MMTTDFHSTAVFLVTIFAVVAAANIQDDTEEMATDELEYFDIGMVEEISDEFQECLSNGSSSECIAYSTKEEEEWIFSTVERNGIFSGGNSTCRYYTCESINRGLLLICQQVPKQAACGNGMVSRFLQIEPRCCDPVCVGLFWRNPSHEIRFDDMSDISDCDTACCPELIVTERSVSINSTSSDVLVTDAEDMRTNEAVVTKNVTLINATEVTIKQNGDETTSPATNNEGNRTADLLTVNDEDSKTIVIPVVISIVVILLVGGVLIFVFRKKIWKNRRHRNNDICDDGADIALSKFPV